MVILLLEYLSNLKYRMSGSFLHHFQYTALVANEGSTIFLTTHNLTEAEQICNQVAVIHQGTLVVVGRPSELLTSSSAYQLEIIGRGFNDVMITALRKQPMVDTAFIQNGVLYIHLRRQENTTPLIQIVIHHGAEIAEVRNRHESLEEIFLNLMEKE
jgi:ABC-2 type transport system ATP-binding protein